MSNGERGAKLFAAATELLADMDAALARESWNIAVRRAQEVVELALKAVLNYLGADVPKIHDVADHFAAEVGAYDLSVTADQLQHVRSVSARLARERSPAFYFEEDQGEDEAREAAADARRVHSLCARLVEALSPTTGRTDHRNDAT